jgi:hypothetical protein
MSERSPRKGAIQLVVKAQEQGFLWLTGNGRQLMLRVIDLT